MGARSPTRQLTSRGRTRTGTALTGQGILSPLGNSASNNQEDSYDESLWQPTSRDTSNDEIDDDLTKLKEVWPTLPAETRAAIMALVKDRS
jgi:hypothetical protein